MVKCGPIWWFQLLGYGFRVFEIICFKIFNVFLNCRFFYLLDEHAPYLFSEVHVNLINLSSMCFYFDFVNCFFIKWTSSFFSLLMFVLVIWFCYFSCLVNGISHRPSKAALFTALNVWVNSDFLYTISKNVDWKTVRLKMRMSGSEDCANAHYWASLSN